MHQTSPASADIKDHHAAPPSSRQAALIGQFDAVLHMEGDLDALVHEACRVVVEGTGVRCAGVLQYRADEDAFVVQAGIGWPAHMIGRTRVAADRGTTAGIAWLTGQLVQFRRLDAIDRIRMPEALVGHGVHRMVSVPIQDSGRDAFGVLEVGSADDGEFERHDLAFLQRIAGSVAAAVGLHASRADRAQRAELAVERHAGMAGRLSMAPRLQGSAGVSYQQDLQSRDG